MTSLPCVQWGFPVLSDYAQKTCFGQFWLDSLVQNHSFKNKFTKQAKQLYSHWINVWKKAKKCMELLWLEKKIWNMTKKNQCKYHMKWMNFWRNWAKQNVGWRTLKQWRISIRMDEKFQKNQFIQNHSKANSAVAILSWTNSAIILLLYFFSFRNSMN